MQRVLDLDLDFFVQPIAEHRDPNGQHLDPAEYEVCFGNETTLEAFDTSNADGETAAMTYLRERSLLDRPFPGKEVELPTMNERRYGIDREAGRFTRSLMVAARLKSARFRASAP